MYHTREDEEVAMNTDHDVFPVRYKGLLYGFVPIYLDELSECPAVIGRNAFCDLLMDVIDPIYGFLIRCGCALNPYFEPGFLIKYTAKMQPDGSWGPVE